MAVSADQKSIASLGTQKIASASNDQSSSATFATALAERTSESDQRRLGRPSSAGRFRILRPHARGGIGEVFVARDEELGREVALKELQAEALATPDFRARFILEAEVTGELEHPGIVPVYGLGEHPDGRPFYAMRFIRGEPLHDAITRFHGPNGPKEAGERALALRKLLARFLDACNAVGYAHSRGVIHRDLKPANIMLGPYGETLVVDWGLAKLVRCTTEGSLRSEGASEPPSAVYPTIPAGSTQTEFGAVVGTPAFMSPEQAAGLVDQLGPVSDIYALGATLYAILVGRPPIDGMSFESVRSKIISGSFPHPREVDGDLPRALEAICLKAMSLVPARRYPTTRELADDVEAWLADEPVRAWRELQSDPAFDSLRRREDFRSLVPQAVPGTK